MLKKISLVIGTAAMLATVGYTAMAFAVVTKSDLATVLTFTTSERMPLLPRSIANWRVQSLEACPVTDRNQNPLLMTLRGYGVDGFDEGRVLAAATRLIELGCDINQRGLTGHTALHEAILYNEPQVVRFLIANGADPTVTIEIADGAPSESRLYFSGMDSLRFTEELQQKSSQAEDRGEILALLKETRG